MDNENTNIENPEIEISDSETANTENPEIEISDSETANTENPEIEISDSETANTENPEIEISDSETANTENSEIEISDSETANTENSETEISDSETANTENPEIEISDSETANTENLEIETTDKFVHLHVHSEYSMLDGFTSVVDLVKKAAADGMPAIALTDHGTMFGNKRFHVACKQNKIKPILGCEVYVARRGHLRKEAKIDGYGEHLVLLAKNKIGYQNLLKLVSIANVDGVYYKPRIDKELLERYNEGIIALSACLGGEIPKLIENNDIDGASKSIEWYKSIFGEDYYLELQYHTSSDLNIVEDMTILQERVNIELKKLAVKHNVKTVVTNDVHFLNREDSMAHDVLTCLGLSKQYSDKNRFHYSEHVSFKTSAEMYDLVGGEGYGITDKKNITERPKSETIDEESLKITLEIADKVEFFELDQDPIMPEFVIPEEFGTMEEYRKKYSEEELHQLLESKRGDKSDRSKLEELGGYEKALRIKLEADYLKKLVYEGAEKLYPKPFSKELIERIEFELDTVFTMGFPGYFLIVQDFIKAARDMGILVGPGRGSAAGSVLAYCVRIIDVDPIKYDLLFERFLNPDRVSMPDMDIDFDDEGRQQILEWVCNKYGEKQVAHICTYGTMAAKSSIKDVARILELPLSEANRIAKLITDGKLQISDGIESDPDLKKEYSQGDQLTRRVLKIAGQVQGTVRQVGVHACGILIGRDDLTNNVPLKYDKKASLLVTQYDGKVVEDIGLLKMDFLGLKTLSIFKDTMGNIQKSRGELIDLETISLEDQATFDTFCNGDTIASFQFESPGMQKYLKMLKPNDLNDIVAMNALYRPGPMKYIPTYIDRKHGRSPIEYDIPMMEKYLKATYGICVYQEQVMNLSRLLANFTRGDADSLRKAMGKKIKVMMDKLYEKFMSGGLANQKLLDECKEVKKDPKETLKKIWRDWENFAEYAFNKSHSVCYGILGYKTIYFKTHYPSEYMAAILDHNMSDRDKFVEYMDEAKGKMGIDILVPDINESIGRFAVNKNGQIRFGLNAIKGVGANCVDAIISEREQRGEFKDLFDFVERVKRSSLNKSTIVKLALAGAFDGFKEVTRSHFIETGGECALLEDIITYATNFQNDSSSGMASLFAGDLAIDISKPKIRNVKQLSQMDILFHEKEGIGLYLSAHPLDSYKNEVKALCTDNVGLGTFNDSLDQFENEELSFAGMATEVIDTISKNGNRYGRITIMDYTGAHTFALFDKLYKQYIHKFKEGSFIYIKGRINRNFSTGELGFYITVMDDLSRIMEKIKTINLTLDLPSITSNDVKNLFDKLNDNAGDSILNIILKSDTIRSQPLSVNKFRIKLSHELFEYLSNFNGLEVSLYS